MSQENPTGFAHEASQHPPVEEGLDVSNHVRLEADILEAEGSTAATVSTPRERQATQKGLTVLVVDDNPDMRAYVKGGLLQPGTQVTVVLEAADGRAALERVRQGGVDLIISDIVMPHLDGMALCRALQADANLRGLPVLLITGESLPPALPDGASGVLAKPFNATKLQGWVRRLLGTATGRSSPSD